MPLQLPDLDDRNYDDLVEEAISLIPRYAPSWTNHNASDPGITLIELLAYFTEMLIFRLDQIGREQKVNFLRLLVGSGQVNADEFRACSLEDIDRRIQRAVLDLRAPQRAVTGTDYEKLAKRAVFKICGEERQVRVLCVTGKNLKAGARSGGVDSPGHISLIIVVDQNPERTEYDELLLKIRHALEPSRLLTTRLHVVRPAYIRLGLTLVIQPRSGALWDSVTQSVRDRLNRYLSPFAGGGPDSTGWPFGRNVYLSEIYEVLERIPEVDYVDRVTVRSLSFTEEDLGSDSAVIGVQVGIASTVGIDSRLGSTFSDSERIIPDGAGKMAGIRLRPYELVKVVLWEQDIVNMESPPIHSETRRREVKNGA